MNADQEKRIKRISDDAAHFHSSAEDANWLISGWKAEAADVVREQRRAEAAEATAASNAVGRRNDGRAGDEAEMRHPAHPGPQRRGGKEMKGTTYVCINGHRKSIYNIVEGHKMCAALGCRAEAEEETEPAPDPATELIRELRDALCEEHDNWIAMTGGKHRKAAACSTCSLIARATAHLGAEAGKEGA